MTIRYALFGLVCFLVSCGTPTQVGPQHEAKVDFAGYSTFAWTRGAPVVFSGERAPELERRVTHAVQQFVQREFVQAGFVLLPRPDQSDLILQVLFTSVGRRSVSDRAVPGYAEQYGSARDITQVVLSLEILDGKSKRLVWRNSVSQTIFGDLERGATDREIAIAVDRLLAGFPPQ